MRETPIRSRGESASLGALLVLAAGLVTSQAQAQEENHVVQAARLGDAVITVDGRLDEPVWQNAGVIEDLTQQSPHPGEPTPYHTKVLLLRDGHTLYIGLRCEDPDISKAATHTLVRDGWQGNDDNVLFMLDTFGTKRFAYVFQVNASGAMADGLQSPTPAINSNNGVDYNWDGIWQAAVTQDEHGWTAEIAIDTRSLQFTNGVTSWGFNLSRDVPRDLLTLDWAGTTLDSSVFQLQREGTLTGMEGMEQGKGWDFQPYGLAKYQTGVGTDSHAGFDLKYNFNPSLAGLFTYHTDFAEAEADQQQINTTRFPLFFPEKRQFFLQGSNLLSFSYNQGTNFIPFNSRTIGLVNGEVTPLDEGVKVIGQSDSGSLALLDTQMGKNGSIAQSTNLFVGRGTYNLDPELQVGTLVTHGDPTGQDTNTFVGTDATWKTSTFQGDKNLNLSAWAAHSNGNASNGLSTAGNPNGYGVDLEYPNDLWYAHAQYAQYGEDLTTALGFLPRPGTRYNIEELNFQPRPSADSWFNWVHRFWFYGHYWEYDSLGSAHYTPPSSPGGPQLIAKQGKQSSEWFFSPQMLTQSGWYWEFDIYQDYDAPTQDFSIVPNVNIPAGEYTWSRRRIVFNSPTSEPLWWQFLDSQGTFYAGTAHHPLVQVNWNTPAGRLVLQAQQEWLFYYSRQGNGVSRLSTLTGTYSFTPDLYLSTQMQYDADVLHGVSYNARLRWIVGGASNIYLVLNHGLVTETTGLGIPVVATGNEAILKVQWDFRN
ncbi:MAG TPA: carbohydrate binding family 9 domain-containing protein [Gammaproteobacteria bacterium]|nr:carbohydrate binding family 9 domain-containing protein [Gammaproteobacteria bacterium]